MIVSPVRVTPRRFAARAPSTVTGRRSPAPSSQTPRSTSPPSVDSRSVRAAWAMTPAVRSSGTTSLRRIRASTSAVAVACCTGPTRSTIATADFASLTRVPEGSSAASAVRRLVPRRSSRAIRSARLDSDSPTTATMVAIPMAIPSAESTTRARRARRPTAPTRRTSRAESREGLRSFPTFLMNRPLPHRTRPTTWTGPTRRTHRTRRTRRTRRNGSPRRSRRPGSGPGAAASPRSPGHG